MDIKRLTAELSVSGQIGAGDLAGLAAQGFKLVINNRPDGEMIGQPSGASIEAAARAVGLDYVSIPIGGPVDEETVSAFAAALDAATGPVLAYCRSGMRSTSVWAVSQAGQIDPEALIETARGAGYDLSGLRPVLEARHRS